MPFFKKKDKNPLAQAQAEPAVPPQDNRPNLREETSNSGVSSSPSNNDRDSNLSSADTRVNQQQDSNGNRQTVVTTTTTTTTTTVTSDGRVITEQHDRRSNEPGPGVQPRPRSPDNQATQIPIQNSTPAPNIPIRHARRGSQPENLTSSHPPVPQQQAPPVPVQQGYDNAPQPTPSPTSLNFSRPGGRRENVKQAVTGIHGVGEGLRGAFNARASEFLGDDPATIAKHREIRDNGLREAKSNTLFQRVPVGQDDEHRSRLRRRSGNLGGNGVKNEQARNF